MKRQLFLSSGVPCKSLGNHARGTEILRPSLRSTASVSAVTLTFCAFASAVVNISSPRAGTTVRVSVRVRVGARRRGFGRGREVAVVYEAALGRVVAQRLKSGPDVLVHLRLARGCDFD